MTDKAHKSTDKLLAELEAKLEGIYKQAGENVEAKAAEYFKRFAAADAKKAAQVAAGKLSEGEYIRWRKNKMLYGEHWKRLENDLAREYLATNQTAITYVNGRLPDAYALNYNHSMEDIASQVSDLGGDYHFELVDAQTVKNLAVSDKTLLPYKYVDGARDVRWNTQKVNSAVLQGILAGDSVADIAKRLRTVTGMNRTSAIRNARTTVTSAECKGRQDSYEQAEADGIKLKREWMAAIDLRTRHAHRLLDGQLADVDKPFKSELGPIMYPGDPNAEPANVYNCRCTIAARVISIDGVNVDDEGYEDREYADRSTAHIIDFGKSKAILTSGQERGIIKNREMAMSLRQPASHVLTENEIRMIKQDAKALEIDDSILRFNTGGRTGFLDEEGFIGICGDVLPDANSKNARDRMSSRAVLAHEYYGHYLNHPSQYPIGDWRDEFRASYEAAVKSPNLSDEDRAYLMIDAYDRAREAGEHINYDEIARRIIYGY